MDVTRMNKDSKIYVAGHTVKEFVQEAFRYVGIELSWFGEKENEVGVVTYVEPKWLATIPKGMTLIKIDPRYYRPTEVDDLQADITKAKTLLKWQPRVTFDELVQIMICKQLALTQLVLVCACVLIKIFIIAIILRCKS